MYHAGPAVYYVPLSVPVRRVFTMQWPAVYSASPQRPGKEDIYHAVASSLFCFPSASVTVRRVFTMQWPAVYSASPQRPSKEGIYHAVTAVYSVPLSVPVRRVFTMQGQQFILLPLSAPVRRILPCSGQQFILFPLRVSHCKEGIYHAVASSLFCFPSAPR